MKALELESGIIFKERCRYIDRLENTVVLIFAIRMKYGETVTAELVAKERDIQVDIDETYSTGLWPIIKDASIEEIIDLILANKDFVYLQTDQEKEDAEAAESGSVALNEAKYQKLRPFYNSLFPYLNTFPNPVKVDI